MLLHPCACNICHFQIARQPLDSEFNGLAFRWDYSRPGDEKLAHEADPNKGEIHLCTRCAREMRRMLSAEERA